MPTSEELRMLQALPLDLKVARTKQRIREWVDYWGKDHVFVSFSGGKDSTVLLHIVREMYGDEIPAVFVNTGLEYPEIQRHVRTFSNVVILNPKKNFHQVLTEYGYPVISKEVSNCIESTRAWCSKFLNVEREREREQEPKHFGKSTADVWREQIFGGGGITEESPMMSCSSSGLDRICAAHPQSPTTYARCVELVHSRMINEQFVPWWTQKLFGEGDAGIRLIKGNIPSKSRYSSVKYAPLLDADFKISPKCCNIMKKAPLKDYFKETKRRPITGMMAEESLLRKSSWIQRGCNAFGGNDPKSNPMSFWTDQDVFKYVVENNVKLADVYGEVVEDGDYGQIAMLKYDNQRLKCTGVNRSGWILTAA